MTFSLISVAVLCITALVIVIEVVRAIYRGRNKTLVTLASLVLAIFCSIIITKFLSNLFAGLVLKVINSQFDISKIAEKLPSIDNILFAYSDSVIAPVLFLIVFLLVRIIIAIVIKIVYKANEKKQDNKPYESEEAPEYKKNPKLINALLGALCGFIVMIAAISPIMGSLKTVTKTFKFLNEENGLFSIKIKNSAVIYFDKCSNDFVGNVIYYCGGNLIYRSVATSDLNDNYFELGREIDNTFATAGNLVSMDNVLNRIDTATDDEKTMLKTLGNDVDKAETLKSATSDILPVLAKKWLNDEEYEGSKKPNVSKVCESFFDKMLYVCKSSTPDTVGADLSTLLNVYLIAYENDILVSDNYKEMIEKAKVTGAFDLIKKELNKNPRMAGISMDIDTMGMKSIATALQSFNFENYDALMGDITNVLNNAITLEGQERYDYVTRFTKDYINKYGIDVGDDVINEVSKRLIDELVDHRKAVTVDDLKEFWDKYSVKKNNGSDSNTVIPPEALVPPQSDENNENDETLGDNIEDSFETDFPDDSIVDVENDGTLVEDGSESEITEGGNEADFEDQISY